MTESSLSETLDAVPGDRTDPASLPPLQVGYEHGALASILDDRGVLAVIGFGSAAPPAHADPRYLWLPLEPVHAQAPFEVWRVTGEVQARCNADLRWVAGDHYAAGFLEVDEAAHGGIVAAARHAYRALARWTAAATTPHILRIWNYLDAINDGSGDTERYREFCHGRAEGMRAAFARGFPAATAIGVRDGRRILRIYWIAAREPGVALENPRQISAWRYPRQYGPSAPTFARAMHAPTCPPQLYISGTAAIVGHSSHHSGDFAAQLDETLANFSSLLDAAKLPGDARFGDGGLLKVYVRHADDAARTRELLTQRLPAGTGLLVLHGDICRRELLIEIDGIQTT